jgi:hypothetical protein
MAIPFRLDTSEFDRTVRKYMELSKRDWAQVLNTKAFFIARRATLETKKADPKEIRALRERAAIGTGTRYNKSGKARKVTIRDDLSTSRAARILQAARRDAGQPAIPRAELAGAVRRFIARRLSSVAYLRSGWIPAIKILEPLSDVRGSPRADKGAKQFGRPKGGAKPARGLWRTAVEIFNAAVTRKKGDEGLRKYGQDGLQLAFNHELRSMKDYVERKLTARAQQLGIRTK